MNRSILAFFSFSLSLSSTYSQDKPIDTIIYALQKDQLLFEKVFVHTNKTTYLDDDTIWFKAYVAKNNNKPSEQTTLLYVDLFTESGELIDSKNVFISKGVGKGQFELKGNLPKGRCYIQAFTNYMKNFGEQNKYIHQVNILGDLKDKSHGYGPNYDIQVFPEGGFLLENATNTIGIKALINGKGCDFKGKIVDSKNREVVSFKNEYLGMSKCSFYYKALERYEAILDVNDTILRLSLPKAKRTGLVLNMLNSDESVLNMELQTNLFSINNLENNYTLLFHQKNKLLDYVEVSFKDTSKVKLEIKKEGFFNGVNSVTVFKNKQPILERKFFVYKEKNKANVLVEKLYKENDSILYKLKIKDLKEEASLSVSVLSNNMDYHQVPTIESAFLLTPYVKGYVENPAYYFDTENKNRKKDIDLLLLTQGWTQYVVQEYIHKLNPKYKYNFESGFKLNGYVSPVVSNNLGLISKNNKVVAEIFLNNKTQFSFKNLLVYKGDSIKLAFLKGKNRNEAVKPRNIYFDTLMKKERSLSEEFQNEFVKLKKEKTELVNESIKSVNIPNVTELEEVKLKGKKRRKQYYEDKVFADKYRDLVFDIGAYYKLDIPEKYFNKNEDLGTFLKKERGVEIINARGIDYLVALNKGVGLSIDGREISPINTGMSLIRAMFIDMEDVEAIAFQPNHTKRGIDFIQVFTTDNYKKGIKDLYKTYVFKNGYDGVKKYYTPIYGLNMSNEQEEIDWKPNLQANSSGEVVFKIAENKNIETLQFLIQGFTTNGLLISDIIFKENNSSY